MASDIWSIAITEDGIGACLLHADFSRQCLFLPWTLRRANAAWIISPEEVLSYLAEIFKKFSEISLPQFIALATPHASTAILVDEHGSPFGDIYLSSPPAIPRSHVPERFAEDDLCGVFRQSIIRRLQYQNPNFSNIHAMGVWSLGAFVCHILTGLSADTSPALGMPQCHDVPAQEFYNALGGYRELCHHYIRPSGDIPIGSLTKGIRYRLHCPHCHALDALSGIAVFHAGSSLASFAYAACADSLSWAVSMGFHSSALWTAGKSALHLYEILLKEDKNIDNSALPTKEQHFSNNDWTSIWNEIQQLETLPGPITALSGYGYLWPDSHLWMVDAALQTIKKDQNTPDIIDFETLRHAALGSRGLHWIQQTNGYQCIGMQPFHDASHYLRALLESQFYDIREKREYAAQTITAPIRMAFSAPWPKQCAQWAADILKTPIMLIDANSTTCAAIGTAIATFREIFKDCQIRASLQADIITPSKSSSYYDMHYQIHKALIYGDNNV